MKYRFSLIASVILTTVSVQAEESLGDIERISVTSDFRTQSIQQIPASVSVLTAELIEQRQAQFVSDLLNTAANVNFASGASRGRFIQIRGIGERSQFTNPVNPSVALIIDGIDFSNNGGMGTLFDLQQVEVLRGPQVVSIGANALAGALVFTSQDPSAETTGQFSSLVAQDDSWQVGAALGGAINEQWQYRVSANQYKSDGQITNDFLERDNTNNIDEFTARAKLRWLASEDLTINTALHFVDVDNGYDAFSLDNTRRTLADEPGKDTLKTKAASVAMTFRGWNWAELNSVVSYNDTETHYQFDEDWAYVGIHPYEYSSKDNYARQRNTATLDARLISTPEGKIFNDTTAWVVGVYAKDDDADLTRVYTYLSEDFQHHYNTNTYALYGEVTYPVTDSTQLVLGLRFEHFEIDYRDSDGFDGTSNDDMLGSRLMLQTQWSEETMVYGSISRGYKAGGVNPDSLLPSQYRRFDPEYNWNYETGIKTIITEYDLMLRAAAFYISRHDMQGSYSFVEERDDGSSLFIDYINNASGTSSNYGLELESQWQVNADLLVVANLGWLETEGDRRQNGDDEQAHAPNYQFYVSASYQISQDWFTTIEFEGKDKFYFSDSHDEKSVSFQQVHASLNYSWNDWLFSLWGHNISNEDYYVRGFGGFGNDPRKSYQEEPYYQFGDAQQFGLSANYQF